MKLTCLAGFILVACAFSYAQTAPVCANYSMPLSNGTVEKGISIRQLIFGSGADGSGISFTVSNNRPSAIISFAMIVEFSVIEDSGFETKGKMFVPILFATDHAPPNSLSTLMTQSPQLLSSPVDSGEEFTASNVSQQTVKFCPREANIVFLNVMFSDGKALYYSAPHWALDPRIRQVSAIDFDHAPSSLPAQIALSLSIDTRGRVISSHPSRAEKNMEQWLAAQVANWQFDPRIEDGKPTNSTVSIILEFHDHFDRSSSARQSIVWVSDKPVAIPVDVYRTHDSTSSEAIFAGGETVFSR
jgi:hypothetical protein